MKIAIASDHGGFELKGYISDMLKTENIEVLDLGNHTYDKDDDYPDFANNLAKVIAKGDAEKGIVICGSGVGACIAANKTRGIRASVCHDTYSAHQGVEHDNMNVLCLGARIVGNELAKDIVSAFINAKFINSGRFLRRLNKVEKIENSF